MASIDGCTAASTHTGTGYGSDGLDGMDIDWDVAANDSADLLDGAKYVSDLLDKAKTLLVHMQPKLKRNDHRAVLQDGNIGRDKRPHAQYSKFAHGHLDQQRLQGALCECWMSVRKQEPRSYLALERKWMVNRKAIQRYETKMVQHGFMPDDPELYVN